MTNTNDPVRALFRASGTFFVPARMEFVVWGSTVHGEPLDRRHAGLLAFSVGAIDLAQLLDHEPTLFGEVDELVDEIAATVGQAIGLDDWVTFGKVSRSEAVGHEHRWLKLIITSFEEGSEVLASVFAACVKE